MRRIKIFIDKKRMKIYFLILSGTTTNPRISIPNAIMMFDPFMPPLKTQIVDIPIIAIIIIGVTKGVNYLFKSG